MESRQDQINEAGEAERLLANPVFEKACQAFMASQMVTILGTPPGDLTSQAACAKLQAIDGIKGELKRLVNNGLMAQKVR